jgi:nucleoside-diphosphate-sugar epimerase
VLEGCRTSRIAHLVYASSSSVYGANHTLPFSEDQRVDHPVSLYAATKKADELFAHSYSHLYALPTTGLRFFTVYGPWGRPDMAPMLFTKAILAGTPIRVFNEGRMRRDFTYVDDIVEAVARVLELPPAGGGDAPYAIYNIGNHDAVELTTFIATLERLLGRTAIREYAPMQPGTYPRVCGDRPACRAHGVGPAHVPRGRPLALCRVVSRQLRGPRGSGGASESMNAGIPCSGNRRRAIGANFVLDWLAVGDEAVVNLDKLTYAGNLGNLAAVAADTRHIFVRGDIGERAQVDALLAQHRPRAIVNFAAESHVDRSIHGPAAFIATNVVGTFRCSMRRATIGRHCPPRSGRRSASCTYRPTRCTDRSDPTTRRSRSPPHTRRTARTRHRRPRPIIWYVPTTTRTACRR